ncbi:glycoside hydrolase family 117 protein [Zobellia galactanivorans]|uniref:glycoside hydrolase family 117 protein n=1 Tax=Zobellia galactanivorans (strain DSM 12802 / CCUG 47099 / CIP 106680 / NCIMB 13871 / Dsij) TaxID=63186 RepID=UPI001C0700AC|nr:family 43 glycosylhydrolase [Zobellia galactanivorans]MBU3028404.1 family 43 glycosylhydrolase [Zobellia galactanivorans]
MRKNAIKRINIKVLVFLLFIGGASCYSQKKQESAAYKRFRASKLRFDKYNEFNTKFSFSDIKGIGYEEGVTRRDPSSIIKIEGVYYVWYTRPPSNVPVVGPKAANDSLRAFHWDMASIYYATSKDGYNWKEQGVAVDRGPKGSFDARSVFTPDILVANNKYYLFYQAAGSLKEARWNGGKFDGGDFNKNKIGMSWSDSPTGPWHRWEKPILEVGPEDSWDGEVVHDPTLVVREGKYWLYYKSAGRVPWKPNISDGVFTKEYADMPNAVIGVAIADKPEGPYKKSVYNPVLIGGHECIVWPYRKGVCAFLSEGPEANSIQYAEDGINFYPVKHGLEKPEAGGTYRVGNFVDTDSLPGQGITWGLSHVLGKWNYLRRFDCDLSIQKGDSINREYEKVLEYKMEKD